MSLCYNCGNTLEPGMPFCTECGTAASRAPEAPQPPPAPSQWDSTLVATVPPLPAFDDFAATRIKPASTPKSRKRQLIVVGVGVLVIAAAVLLLVWKPFSNKPPSLGGIEASQPIVHAGDGVTLTARAIDPNDDTLSYQWMASAGRIIGDGSAVTLSTSDVDASSGRTDVKIHLTVSDGRGGMASGDQIITVTPSLAVPFPVNPPDRTLTVSLAADQRSVRVGDVVNLAAQIANRDPNEVTYEWKTSAGTIQAGGRTASLQTSGVQLSGSARQVSVTVTVKDAAGASVADTATINVLAAAPSNWPPTISLRPSRRSVQQGEDVEIFAEASDRDGDTLSYSWNVAGGHLVGGGNRVTLKTSGSDPGQVVVTATVSDGRGESVNDRVSITINPRPNHLPVISSVDADRSRVRAGERVSLRVRASDLDNDQLTYGWTASAGSIRGSGPVVTLDTSGVEPNSGSTQVKVTVTVSDQRGGVTTENASVTVTSEQRPQPLPPARLSASQTMQGDDLVVTIAGNSGGAGAPSGSIEVTAGPSGTQVSGSWPPGACRIPPLASLQNVDKDKIVVAETPLPSNRYSRIIVRVRPKNPRQTVRFTIHWQAL